MDRFLDFFEPPPPLWTILLNKAYVVIWTFGIPPPPCHVHMGYECPLIKMDFISILLAVFFNAGCCLHSNYTIYISLWIFGIVIMCFVIKMLTEVNNFPYQFFTNKKFVDFTKLNKSGFHKKLSSKLFICLCKHLPSELCKEILSEGTL